MLVRRGATAVVNHLSFHLTSRACPPFTPSEEQRTEVETDNQILQTLNGQDEVQLQNLIDLRRILNGVQYDGRARSQWDNFLNAILESSTNLELAPPKDISHNIKLHEEDIEEDHEEDLALEDDDFIGDDGGEYW